MLKLEERMTAVKKSNSTKKPNIVLCAGLVLLCLTFFSVYFTSGLYARYMTKDSAEDSARVAKFNVVVTPKEKELNDIVLATISSGNDDKSSYIITLDNNSEVAVNYELILEYKAGINSNGVSYSFLRGVNNAQTGSLGPNSKINDIMLSFSVNWDEFTEDAKGNSSKDETLEFKVIVKITQID